MTGLRRFTKSSGLTLSESYLGNLCERSFLSLWSYPNVYSDQGTGKEVCDVLVVFGDDLIIFSDKKCEFPDSGDPNRDWARWYRRAVVASEKQIFGAERWIRSFPDRLFLDQKGTQPFPLPLPPLDRARFHRIVVASGATTASAAHRGGTGSLRLWPIDVDHATKPFCVGRMDRSKGFIHVLDEVSLDAVMGALDTIVDFIWYLRKKENLIMAGRLASAEGEQELLARFLRNMGPDGLHDFAAFEDAALVLPMGDYERLRADPRYLAKIDADRVSYVWDGLIEEFCKNIRNRTLARGNDTPIEQIEMGVRLMASVSRFQRRNFANAMLRKYLSLPHGAWGVRIMGSTEPGSPRIAFIVLFQPRSRLDYDAYRQRRCGTLVAYCKVVKLIYPQFDYLVGLGMETAHEYGQSEDLVCLDATSWSESDREEAAQIQRDTGILTTVESTRCDDREYPDIRPDVS
jgi:hypothetical protein